MMLKRYNGSCHCGACRFEADIDLSAGTNKCNCSICRKSRNWNAIIQPNSFRELTSHDSLTDYQFGRKTMHHFFCRLCGVRTFARGYHKAMGGHYVAVQLSTLDNADAAELLSAPVRYADGQHDAWGVAPVATGHL